MGRGGHLILTLRLVFSLNFSLEPNKSYEKINKSKSKLYIYNWEKENENVSYTWSNVCVHTENEKLAS